MKERHACKCVLLQQHHGSETASHPPNTRISGDGDWSVPGFGEWTSFLSWIGTQTLRPLLLLSGSLILKTQFEELQLLLQGSLWPETFEHVAPLPNPHQLRCHCRCSLSAVRDKSHAVTLQIGLQHALRLKPSGHIGAARTNYWLFVMHYHYFPERVAVLVQPEHKKMKHMSCFILNVNTSFLVVGLHSVGVKMQRLIF